ncbi:DUF445 domain-containing protein [Paenibacillus bovis]|uniref:DUF445 domain-containing protein n=1 Tax=Paenibacillus bovis TaxID=1616788 RepID=A0A172ZCC1_9BACL|nr:DUF445 domain-containing protein [Paenibacillus bovis]ANF95295.1 hypothetical protein AR543_04210 [Paenibacillus bovis]
MNSRYLAGISLAVMAVGFIITLFLPDTLLVKIIQGGFEAGLVGGIADWFAVTALFRHPLGLPIPHTSLLTRNRDKIIRSLISAMENELLNKESIEAKLRHFKLFPFAVSAITRQLGKKTIRRELIDLVIPPISRIPLEPVSRFIASGLADYAQKADLHAAGNKVLTHALNERYDEKALDHILTQVHEWALRPASRDKLGEIASEQLENVNLGGLKGFAFQAFAGMMNAESLGGILQNILLSTVSNLQQADSEYRESILREVRVQLFQVVDEENNWDRIKDWTRATLEGDAANIFMMERLEELRGMIVGMLERERDSGGRHLFIMYRSIIRDLSKDQEKINAWEERLLQGIIGVVGRNHYRLGQLVKENLDQMDNDTLVHMLEEKVGNDLQWIRVNGAICGFIVGLILTVIQLLVA